MGSQELPDIQEEDPARFKREVKRATRATGISAGAIAIIGYPSWIAFDYLVEPASAGSFVWIRLGLTLPIALLWLTIVFTKQGRLHPELPLLGILLLVNLGISVMIAEVETHYAPYALGMSLTVYASAFLLIWPPRYTATLVGASLALLTTILLLSDPIGGDSIATVYFYLVTAGVLSFIGQFHRQATAWREFQSLVALEREQSRSSELVSELDRISREDALTGLANRRAWDEALAGECVRSARRGDPFAVLLCDLDGLKAINDRLGHAVGDSVLRSVARLLANRARDGDVIARIGGDEFALLTLGCNLLDATELAEELRRMVEAEATAAAGLGGVTISVGVADWEGGDDSPETMMLRADRRLYTAKATRNVVCAGDVGRS